MSAFSVKGLKIDILDKIQPFVLPTIIAAMQHLLAAVYAPLISCCKRKATDDVLSYTNKRLGSGTEQAEQM